MDNTQSRNSSIFTNDIIKELKPMKLSNLGVKTGDVVFGINRDDFDNEANPYFVYRAYAIDNLLNRKKTLNIRECKLTEDKDTNQRWFNKSFCVDL